jgi:parvulin-like peptidyl-prolyl isomerase
LSYIGYSRWLVVALALMGCEGRQSGDARGAVADAGAVSGDVVARYKGGAITREELVRESRRLPPALREQFESPVGQEEFARSLVDKRLLVEEARRRGLAQQQDLARQVRELEERLLVQALLAEEERGAGPATEPELRAWYDAHRSELRQPERVHLARVLASASGGTAAERSRARARAEEFARRLRAGEPLARVQSAGDGPERARAGDMGLFARGELKDARLEEAAFALRTSGQVSAVVETAEGFAVLQLLERRVERIPPFEEVRAEVEGRVAPSRQRRVFDALRTRLRGAADVHVEVSARP